MIFRLRLFKNLSLRNDGNITFLERILNAAKDAWSFSDFHLLRSGDYPKEVVGIFRIFGRINEKLLDNGNHENSAHLLPCP